MDHSSSKNQKGYNKIKLFAFLCLGFICALVFGRGLNTSSLALADSLWGRDSFSGAQQFSPVTCSVFPATANINQTVTFSASFGDGMYLWSNSNGGVVSSQPSFAQSFSQAGDYSFIVFSHGMQAWCSVHVNNPPVQQFFTASVAATQQADAAVNCPNGGLKYATAPATAMGNASSNFSQADAQAKALAQASSNAYSQALASAQAQAQAQCTVAPPASPVSCYASPSVINAGQSASFFASGGSNISWSSSNGGTVSFGQSFFQTFPSPGNYTFFAVSSNGQSAPCSVQVNAPAPVYAPPQPVYAPPQPAYAPPQNDCSNGGPFCGTISNGYDNQSVGWGGRQQSFNPFYYTWGL